MTTRRLRSIARDGDSRQQRRWYFICSSSWQRQFSWPRGRQRPNTILPSQLRRLRSHCSSCIGCKRSAGRLLKLRSQIGRPFCAGRGYPQHVARRWLWQRQRYEYGEPSCRGRRCTHLVCFSRSDRSGNTTRDSQYG